ncbi:MAG: hypothetical protein IJC48_09475 [Clostridia bacterium]|nr:hypothetical protein [Clostridia bacterium]
MTLPGKLTICFLEEDVPQKAYFRIKPLFVKGDGAFDRVENAKELLPDEGGIRIVPDKNESSRFKARMRTLGKFCVLDLTRHPNENDKIRPNKNYSPERMENNRNIVYSDVIERCPDEWLSEVYRVDEIAEGKAKARLAIAPTSPLAALISGGKITGPYTVQALEEEGEYEFTLNAEYEMRTFEESAYTRLYKLPFPEEAPAEIIVTSNGLPLFQKIAKQAEEAAEEEAKAEIPEAEPDVKPEVKAEAEKEKEKEEIIPEASAPAIEKEAQPAAEAAPCMKEAPVIEAKAEEEKAPAAEKAETPKEAEEPKREIEKTKEAPEYLSRRALPRIQSRDSASYSQTGLNPRRGRSLSEVVDEGWRKSRIEQLGSPIPGDVTGRPVMSPIERAARSFKDAWALKEARGALLDELLAIDELSDALAPRFSAGGRTVSGAEIEQLNDLEAERLKILGEIDELKRQKTDKRAQLMEEARQTHAAEIKKMESTAARLKAECEKRLKEAEDARDQQAKAAKLLSGTMRDALKQDLIKYAIHARCLDGAQADSYADASDYAHSPETYEPTGAQLVSDIRKIFEESGKTLSNDEAVNLLACIAIGKMVVVSGETGCGKSSLVRDAVSALGLNAPGSRRFVCINAGEDSVLKNAEFKALTRFDDMNTLRVLMLDDANQLPVADQARGLTTWAEDENRESALRVIMTVLDDQIGYPLNPRILDRSFMIRMDRANDLSWTSAKKSVRNAEKTVQLNALLKIFDGSGHIPGEVINRLQVLREKLAALNVSISGRALSDMYAYCASCIPLMTVPPKAVLDYALSQRAVPHILATAKIEVLDRLPELLSDMPRCLSLMNQPLPLPPL